MTDYKKGGSGNAVSFLDVFLNAMATFVVMTILLFMLIMVQAKNKKQEEKKAGYTEGLYRITATWPDHSDDDVDLYVQDPLGNIAYFRSRDVGLMHLEHDDLGRRNDIMQSVSGEEVVLSQNIEHVIIRGTIPGEYTVTVHMYTMRSVDPIAVHIRLAKSAGDELVKERDVTLAVRGAEATAFRFTLSDKGAVLETNELEKSLAYSKPGSRPEDHFLGEEEQ